MIYHYRSKILTIQATRLKRGSNLIGWLKLIDDLKEQYLVNYIKMHLVYFTFIYLDRHKYDDRNFITVNHWMFRLVLRVSWFKFYLFLRLKHIIFFYHDNVCPLIIYNSRRKNLRIFLLFLFFVHTFSLNILLTRYI